MSGKLSVVSTPIGNLQDITLRAIETLKQADTVASEDTRRTSILLKHLNITKPQISLHKFNEAKRLPQLIQQLQSGQHIALVTDAGTPGISDPGERIISEALNHDVFLEIIPGPSAVLHALTASGLPMTPFYFGGFLPVKKNQRLQELENASSRTCTSVYFESPHRLLKTLQVLSEMLPDRRCSVARELTKKFEQTLTDTPQALLAHFTTHSPKGEFTLLIEGHH